MEESPKSQFVDGPSNNLKDKRRQPYLNPSDNNCLTGNNVQYDSIPHPKNLLLPQSLQARKKNGNFRSPNLWNHTYMDIQDSRIHKGTVLEDDPVYEEIGRNDIQVSDMSDEDGKRQSDMSRQSSRSYGDHRPLIPCSPSTDRNIHVCLENNFKHKDYCSKLIPEMDQYHHMIPQNIYQGDARSLAAVLDGETVVCHLEPQERFSHDPYASRTLVLPQYSES